MSALAVRNSELGVHQIGKDEDFVVLHPDALKSFVKGRYADTLVSVHERLEGVREVQIVIDLFNGFLARHAVLEVECADARLDLVRCGDLFRNLGISLSASDVAVA